MKLSFAGARVLSLLLIGRRFRIDQLGDGDLHRMPRFSGRWFCKRCPTCGHETDEALDLRPVWPLFEAKFLDERPVPAVRHGGFPMEEARYWTAESVTEAGREALLAFHAAHRRMNNHTIYCAVEAIKAAT